MTATTDLTRAPSAGPLAGLPDLAEPVPVASGLAGQVFRARQPSTDRMVAVKVAGVAVLDPRVHDRFRREVAIAGRLSDHPCLVTVLSHGISPSGYPYLVMPWYERGSLADEARSRGPLPVPEMLGLGIRIAAGLDHVHRNGVVHRDVKPANILLSGHGESVLADFGGATNARHLGTVTTSYTPVHAAPELLRDEVATSRADVWSLASTLWTALAGRRPFAAEPDGLAGELSRAAAGELGALGRSGVPASLESLLALALSPAPDDRPSAREFAHGLQDVELALGLPVTAIPASSPPRPHPGRSLPATPVPELGDPVTIRRPAPEPAPPPARRRGLLVAGLAIGAAGLLAGVVSGAAVLLNTPGAPSSAPRTVVTQPHQAGSPEIVAHTATSITVRWQDTNAGRAQYAVLVDPAPRSSELEPAGATQQHRVDGLEPRTSYCFQVLTGGASGSPITTPVCAQTD